MVRIQQFEEIKGWQKGRDVCRMVYAATKAGSFSRDYALCNQIRRAAISIVSNIAEGFESQNDRTFVRYLCVAKASTGEVRAQTYIALDQGDISQKQFDELHALCTETSRLIAGFITYLQPKELPSAHR